MSGLFPFAVIQEPENSLTMTPMNGEDTLSESLLEAISNFEENAEELFEIDECTDPEIVEFIIPAFFQFVESLDLDESDLEVAQSMVVYGATYFADAGHLQVFIQFEGGSDLSDDSDEDSDESDDESDNWK